MDQPHDHNSQTSSAQARQIHNYGHGEEILKEGVEPPCFFVVIDGQVQLSRKGRILRILEELDVFGLEGVVLHKPSPCTAKALVDSRVAMYGRDALDYFTRESPWIIHSILASSLRQLLFMTLEHEEDAFSLENMRLNFYSDGDVVFSEGRVEKEFYRLVSTDGGLAVTARGRPGDHVKKPGAFLGTMEALLQSPHETTVTSVGETVLEVYDPEDLGGLVRDYPELAVEVVQNLITRFSGSKPKRKPRKAKTSA